LDGTHNQIGSKITVVKLLVPKKNGRTILSVADQNLKPASMELMLHWHCESQELGH